MVKMPVWKAVVAWYSTGPPTRYLTDSHSPNPLAVKPASTLEYALTVTNASGCSSLQPDIVKITVTTPKIFAGNDTTVQINQPFNLKAVDVNNAGFIQYNWQPQSGLNNSTIANPVATLNNTTYRVTAKTASGCEASDNVTIEIYTSADIYVPNAFTPNGDSRNDYAVPILQQRNFYRLLQCRSWPHERHASRGEVLIT